MAVGVASDEVGNRGRGDPGLHTLANQPHAAYRCRTD